MKTLLVLCLLIPLELTCQRHDNVWLYGYGNTNATPNGNFGGYQANFSTTPPLFTRARKPMDFTVFTMSMCDSAGNLQFYSNGLRINNRLNQVMENGDTIGYGNGNGWRYFSANSYGNFIRQCGFSLSYPGHDSLFCFFYTIVDIDSLIRNEIGYQTAVSEIDMRFNNGLGKVSGRERIINNDSFGYLTACKHANGRDWWVVGVHVKQDRVLEFLLTPSGITQQRVISIGNRPLNNRGAFSAIFSPDGERYALHTFNGYIRLFQFDRCTGDFTYERDISVDRYYPEGSISFSPNSRYLYKFDYKRIAQLDLWSNPLRRDTIGRIDTVTNPYINYAYSQLMPDGKIYSIGPGSSQEIHIIHAPDSAGMACRVQTNAIISPVFNWSAMPHYPNYRLGPLRGSGCDTLVSGVVTSPTPPEEGLRLFPNPSNGYQLFTSEKPLAETSMLTYYDITGKPVRTFVVPMGSSMLDVELQLPNAVYYVRLSNSREDVLVDKIVMIRD